MCRNEVKLSSAKQALLKCKYVTNRSAFLSIAPLKLEEVSLDPYLVIYHDVLYDSEIITILKISKPKVFESLVEKVLNLSINFIGLS